jgi:MoaA/NifB/PqqE/SkfB family radical SAM enzyme
MIDISNLPRIAYSIARSVAGKRIPLKVTQYITFRCNADCIYCGRKNIESKELSTERIKRYIAEFKRMGTLFWSFNGGECLLRNDLGELLDFVKKSGLKCNLVTNGFLVPQRIEWLKNVDLIITSIDGPQAVQDAIRGPGAFDKNMKALEVLAGHGIKTVVVSVLSSENIDSLDEILKCVEQYGHSWDVQPLVVHRGDREGKAKKYFIDEKKFREAVGWIIRKKNEGAPIFSALSYLEDMKKYPHCEANKNCWASKLFCSIAPDGSLYPCAEFIGTDDAKTPVIEMDIPGAFHKLPDMSKCSRCFFSCYSEYNLLLNNKFKSALKISKNLMRGKWFWS